MPLLPISLLSWCLENQDRVALTEDSWVCAACRKIIRYLLCLMFSHLTDKQKNLLSMLSDFDRFCRNNSLTFFLGGGTALGAVRHKGFIPWDDDVDVAMPRADFERLCALADAGQLPVNSFGGEDYLFAGPYTPGHKTCVARLSCCMDNDESAMLDVFCVENSPSGFFPMFFHGIRCLVAGYLLACARDYLAKDALENNPALLTKGRRLRLSIGSRLNHPIDHYRSRAWAIYGAYAGKKTRYVTVPAGRAHYFRERLLTKDVFPPAEGVFENLILPIPNNAHLYLSRLYGDYMRIPEEDEREIHVMADGVGMSVRKGDL